MFVTQSRIASLSASLSVREPLSTARTSGPQQFHPPDIRRLADDIRRAHIHHARQPGARRHRRRGDAVLAGAGFGDDAPFAHPLREQNLPGGVVDFVRAGVIQVFAF